MSKKILGYGICGPNEKYLEQTLDCFASLCDTVVILGNRIDGHSKDSIKSRGFTLVEDDREWGTNQHKIKEDFVKGLEKYNPEWLVCLDMDEVLDLTRAELEDWMDKVDSMYVYIVNLWDGGWKREWSFWNIRVWKWNGQTKFVNRPLHCGLAPEWAYYYGSYVPVILYHHGLKDREDRLRKIERYKKYDPDAKYRSRDYYDALSSDVWEPLDVQFIKDSLDKEITVVKRKKVFESKVKKFFYVEKNGKKIDIPDYLLDEHLKRGFKICE